MAPRKRSDAPRYEFPDHPDDPTLGGAIRPELFARLQGDDPSEPAPADEPAT